MNTSNIIFQALKHPWFIQPEAAEYHALILFKFISGQSQANESDEDKPVKEFAYAVDAAGKRLGNIADASDNGVAVINVQGAIMKYDYCGSAGTQSMIKALQQANDNPSISSILLQIDSPGGSVDGTQQFANAVKNSQKPVVAYINGMMCSAAMWIGSAASERIASSNTDVIGSIGTMASWSNYKGLYEKWGIASHEVYATESTHKNIQFREANGDNAEGKPNYEPMIKTWLDPINNEFTSAIQQNLPKADKTVLNGSHFIATEAIKKGLIDQIGTFDTAVKSALKKGTQLQQIKLDNSMKWTKILAFFGIAAAASAQDIKLNDQQVDNLEALLAERDLLKTELAETKTALDTEKASVTRVTGELATANANVQTVTNKLTTANNALAASNDRIGVLEKLSGKPSGTVTDEDPVNAGKKVDMSKYHCSYDEVFS